MKNKTIPYGRQTISDEDVEAVLNVLKSDWLTTGPEVEAFEKDVAHYVQVNEAIAVANGTAALHLAALALNISPGDEVIVPAISHVATANAAFYAGAIPVFCDIDEGTLLIDPQKIEEKISKKTKAIFVTDYSGQPCDYNLLHEIASRHELPILADACHSLGAIFQGKPVGNLATITVLSFHPIKSITTAEGGMVLTDDPEMARRVRALRNHGIDSDFRSREKACLHVYDQTRLGYNYRLTDIQCALGRSQLRKLPEFIQARQSIADTYDKSFLSLTKLRPLSCRDDRTSAYHLYVIRLNCSELGRSRDEIFQHLRAQGIGVNVHYRPIYLHSYYRERLNTSPGLCPVAERVYEEILSLPIFPTLKSDDQERIIRELSTL